LKPANGAGDTPLVTMPAGKTSFDVTTERLKVQLETFLDEHRAALRCCLAGAAPAALGLPARPA